MKYANHYSYSDVNPYEVVRVISDKTIEVRAMNAEKDPTWKPEFVPGGFACHCINQCEQKWIYSSNEEAKVIRIRFSKVRNCWQDSNGRQFSLEEAPYKYYDYNF